MRLFLMAALLALAGCVPAKKEAVLRCNAEARAHYSRQQDQTDEEYTDALSPNIAKCMSAAGFVYQPDQPDCEGSYANAACFDPLHPNNRLRKLLYFFPRTH